MFGHQRGESRSGIIQTPASCVNTFRQRKFDPLLFCHANSAICQSGNFLSRKRPRGKPDKPCRKGRPVAAPFNRKLPNDSTSNHLGEPSYQPSKPERFCAAGSPTLPIGNPASVFGGGGGGVLPVVAFFVQSAGGPGSRPCMMLSI